MSIREEARAELKTMLNTIGGSQIGIALSRRTALLERLLDELDKDATPASRWRENGDSDPFEGHHYDKERALLCLGNLTDDEIANAVYLDPNIGNLTGAKERIRWLSRALEKALDKDRWIPVSERLPENAESVLLAGVATEAVIGFYSKKFYIESSDRPEGIEWVTGVTHWAELIPLPQPPKEITDE